VRVRVRHSIINLISPFRCEDCNVILCADHRSYHPCDSAKKSELETEIPEPSESQDSELEIASRIEEERLQAVTVRGQEAERSV